MQRAKKPTAATAGRKHAVPGSDSERPQKRRRTDTEESGDEKFAAEHEQDAQEHDQEHEQDQDQDASISDAKALADEAGADGVYAPPVLPVAPASASSSSSSSSAASTSASAIAIGTPYIDDGSDSAQLANYSDAGVYYSTLPLDRAKLNLSAGKGKCYYLCTPNGQSVYIGPFGVCMWARLSKKGNIACEENKSPYAPKFEVFTSYEVRYTSAPCSASGPNNNNGSDFIRWIDDISTLIARRLYKKPKLFPAAHAACALGVKKLKAARALGLAVDEIKEDDEDTMQTVNAQQVSEQEFVVQCKNKHIKTYVGTEKNDASDDPQKGVGMKSPCFNGVYLAKNSDAAVVEKFMEDNPELERNELDLRYASTGDPVPETVRASLGNNFVMAPQFEVTASAPEKRKGAANPEQISLNLVLRGGLYYGKARVIASTKPKNLPKFASADAPSLTAAHEIENAHR